MLPHRLAFDDFVFVVMAKSERIAARLALVFDLLDFRKGGGHNWKLSVWNRDCRRMETRIFRGGKPVIMPPAQRCRKRPATRSESIGRIESQAMLIASDQNRDLTKPDSELRFLLGKQAGPCVHCSIGRR